MHIVILFTMGAFDKNFRTVLTGLTAFCAFVYLCQTSLRSLIGVRLLFSQACPEMCQNGTPTILTHKNLNKHPAWQIALAKFILAANLPLQHFHNTFTYPNITYWLYWNSFYQNYCPTSQTCAMLRCNMTICLLHSDAPLWPHDWRSPAWMRRT